MADQVESKQSVDIYKVIDKFFEDAYDRSGLRPFFLGGSVWLSDSVQFYRSKRSAPI